ncbi:hypothetical protein [Wielerella bovis]|uniref:hypothetical protein n=1 Tax=Wielerella bovis TaxID=2917790 RepID=UPI002019A999|nr:hypothetical protein [Wielerella bovis]ULJ66639.1 hypothetical protein MIS31_10380 [Wielerella bovis]
MSDLLRDDVQETAVVAERWFLGAVGLLEDYARGRDVLKFGVGTMLHDVVRGRDGLLGKDLLILHDVARGRDVVLSQMISGYVLVDVARGRERYVSPEYILLHDVARGLGAAIDGSMVRNDVLHDAVRVVETWFAGRVLADVLVDKAHGRDGLYSGYLNGVVDAASGHDAVFSGSLKVGLLHDVAHGLGRVFDALDNGQVLVSRGKLCDAVFGQSVQGVSWHDRVAVLDRLFSDDTQGAMIWTANVDNWAMSRYLPSDVSSLAVVDGVVWGLGKNAVYELSGDEVISGSLKMGLVDCSGGGLQHPVASYVEYSCDAQSVAELAVTMSQSGRNERFVYRLAHEKADSLTNGRFVLGRGLRGRHFVFELMLQGKMMFVNDWLVDCAPTKRRI